MKRKPKFLIVLLSAIITIGTLAVTVGKPKYMHLHQFGNCHPLQTEQPQQK